MVRPSPLGSIFASGDDPRLVQVEWKGTNLLVIRYPNDSNRLDELRCRSQWGDVQIQCISYTPDYTKPVAKMPPLKKWFY